MIELKTKFLTRNNKEEFAILSIEEYQSLIQYIEDLEDLLKLRKAKQEVKSDDYYSIEETKKILGISD